MNEIPLSGLFAILALLLTLSAFFSGSETALMTLNRYRLRHLSNAGHPGAKRAERLLARPDRLIGLILLGNNFVNILASSLATIIALRLGGEAAIAIAAGILTLVILIFAEVAPKTLAALRPERLAFPAAWVYVPLLKLAYPLVWVVNAIANRLLGLFGVSPDREDIPALSREELRTVVHEAAAIIPKRHQRMLLGILDLEKATVEDIMIPRNEVDGIDLVAPLDAIEEQLRTAHYNRMPVYEETIDRVVGILHLRDAIRIIAEGGLTRERLREICHPPYFIPEGTRLYGQLTQFQRQRRHMGLVVDEYGDLLGLVTLADLLEEIVGEFTTDPVEALPDFHLQPDGSLVVDGGASIRDLRRQLKLDLPTGGPKTLNGLILEYLETIPDPGTSFKIGIYPVEILQTTENAVKSIRIRTDMVAKKP